MASRETGPTPVRRRAAVKTKTAYHHGDLARTLVAAAAQLIEAGAGARLNLRAAAQAAGVSVAAPYRHFADREALLAAVLADGFHELARRTERARRAETDPMAALVGTALAYVRFAADRPRIYRLMFGPECDKLAHPELMAAGHAALGVLHQAVADCQAAGLIDGDDPEPVALAGWSLTHGLASLHVDGLLSGSGKPAPLEASARAVVGMLINGVRARGATAA